MQLAVHQATRTFYKIADFGAQDGMLLSAYSTTELSLSGLFHDNEQKEVQIRL